ncbi:MAG: transposase, partial [Chloroflexi bacterium]|nr:transposase [Chloroflexota bacterium]
EDVIIRYDPCDLAELRVSFGDLFLCRAICPELAGETVGLKNIIRARNSYRRQLRTTLADRQATVEALLGLRRGDPEVGPLFSEPELTATAPSAERPRLKRYFNDE